MFYIHDVVSFWEVTDKMTDGRGGRIICDYFRHRSGDCLNRGKMMVEEVDDEVIRDFFSDRLNDRNQRMELQ